MAKKKNNKALGMIGLALLGGSLAFYLTKKDKETNGEKSVECISSVAGMIVSFEVKDENYSNPIYEVDFGDGQKDNVKVGSHTYAKAGDYNFAVSVTEGGDVTTTKTCVKLLTITGKGQPGVIKFNIGAIDEAGKMLPAKITLQRTSPNPKTLKTTTNGELKFDDTGALNKQAYKSVIEVPTGYSLQECLSADGFCFGAEWSGEVLPGNNVIVTYKFAKGSGNKKLYMAYVTTDENDKAIVADYINIHKGSSCGGDVVCSVKNAVNINCNTPAGKYTVCASKKGYKPDPYVLTINHNKPFDNVISIPLTSPKTERILILYCNTNSNLVPPCTTSNSTLLACQQSCFPAKGCNDYQIAQYIKTEINKIGIKSDVSFYDTYNDLWNTMPGGKYLDFYDEVIVVGAHGAWEACNKGNTNLYKDLGFVPISAFVKTNWCQVKKKNNKNFTLVAGWTAEDTFDMAKSLVFATKAKKTLKTVMCGLGGFF